MAKECDTYPNSNTLFPTNTQMVPATMLGWGETPTCQNSRLWPTNRVVNVTLTKFKHTAFNKLPDGTSNNAGEREIPPIVRNLRPEETGQVGQTLERGVNSPNVIPGTPEGHMEAMVMHREGPANNHHNSKPTTTTLARHTKSVLTKEPYKMRNSLVLFG